MVFSLTPEQAMLQESASRFLGDRYDDAARRRFRAEDAGFSLEIWQEIARLGWLGSGFSEQRGGFGGGPIETMILMEAGGKALMSEPLLGSMVLPGSVLAEAGSYDDLAHLIEGTSLFAVAWDEPEQPSALEPATVAEPCGDGLAIRGEKKLVLGGQIADVLLVTAKLDGRLAILRVRSDVDGVDVRAHRTLDGGKAANVRFDSARIDRSDVLASRNEAPAVVSEMLARAIAAACAESLGAARNLHDRTLDYLKLRVQFGRRIGEFQALQHRMADMFIALEEAQSLSMMATAALEEPKGDQRDRLLSAAKIGVMARAMHIAREAIQLHGGVGMTDELPVGDGYKRIKSLSLMFGDEDFHLDRMNSLAV
jgi:alkylation response protein AidB-like acyl-CoA dehydrogenase